MRRYNVASSNAGARVRLGITSPCPTPEEMIATTIVTPSSAAAGTTARRRAEQYSSSRLEHSGGDLQRGRPGKAEAAKRVQLPVVKGELHQAGDDERDPGEERNPPRQAVVTDPLIRR